jgi:hypothetical protein
MDPNHKVEGQLIRKLLNAGCHIKKTEPHTQSSNMGEGGCVSRKEVYDGNFYALAAPSDFGMIA